MRSTKLEWPWWRILLIISFIAFAIVTLCNGQCADFFFIDDSQNAGIGFYREMGRLWLSGHLPIFTTRTLLGGNILVDIVNAPFSPQTIIASLLSTQTHSLSAVANFCAFTDLFLIIFGGFWIGRLLKIRDSYALLLGFLIATNPVFLYLYTAAWWSFAHSFAWMVVAIAALLQLRQEPTAIHFLLAVLFGIFLFTSAGTHAELFYIILFAPILILDWNEHHQISRLAIVCLAGIAVALIAAIPLMTEYLLNLNHIARISQFQKDSSYLVPSWGYFINFFNPLYGTYISWFRGYQYIPLSFAYAGVVLLLPLLFKIKTKNNAMKTNYKILMIGIVLALLLSFSPQIGPLRWGFRFIPAFVLCFAAISLYHLEHWTWAANTHQRRRWLFFTGIFFGIIQLFSASSAAFSLKRIAFVIIFILLVYSITLVIPKHTKNGLIESKHAASWAWICSFIAFTAMLIQTPTLYHYLSLVQLNDAVVSTLQPKQPGFTLALAGQTPEKSVWDLSSAQLLARGQNSINGYSSIGHTGFTKIFPTNNPHGYFRAKPTLINMTSSFQSTTHNYVYQLFDIARIYAWKTDITPLIKERLVNAGLTKITTLPNERIMIEPATPTKTEGTLTFQSTPGLVHLLKNNEPRSEWFAVQPTDAPRQLIFNRLIWAGYHATLNGKALPIHSWENTLLAITLPTQSSGQLHIFYEPKSWQYTRLCLLAGIILTLLMMFYLYKRK